MRPARAGLAIVVAGALGYTAGWLLNGQAPGWIGIAFVLGYLVGVQVTRRQVLRRLAEIPRDLHRDIVRDLLGRESEM